VDSKDVVDQKDHEESAVYVDLLESSDQRVFVVKMDQEDQ
jgi:hypothetical protein